MHKTLLSRCRLVRKEYDFKKILVHRYAAVFRCEVELNIHVNKRGVGKGPNRNAAIAAAKEDAYLCACAHFRKWHRGGITS
jgi:hypothetical protein